MSKILTRKQTDHELFGQASSLPPHKLPTNGDALRLIRKYKYDFEGKFSNMNYIYNLVANEIRHFWKKAISNRKSVPLISHKAIFYRLKRIYDKGIQLQRNKPKN